MERSSSPCEPSAARQTAQETCLGHRWGSFRGFVRVPAKVRQLMTGRKPNAAVSVRRGEVWSHRGEQIGPGVVRRKCPRVTARARVDVHCLFANSATSRGLGGSPGRACSLFLLTLACARSINHRTAQRRRECGIALGASRPDQICGGRRPCQGNLSTRTTAPLTPSRSSTTRRTTRSRPVPHRTLRRPGRSADLPSTKDPWREPLPARRRPGPVPGGDVSVRGRTESA